MTGCARRCAPRRSGSPGVLAQLAPAEPEVHGLVALLEIQASRVAARTDPAGDPVLLLDQDRSRWDRLLINRGLAALERAEDLGGERGPYALQAAIAACHARAFRAEDTDWPRIVGAIRRAGRGTAVAGCRAEPGGRGLDGVWPAGWP